MPLYEVFFKHIEETTYRGTVEADSYDEAMAKVKSEPFDIDNLEEWEVQGLDVIDIEVDEV